MFDLHLGSLVSCTKLDLFKLYGESYSYTCTNWFFFSESLVLIHEGFGDTDLVLQVFCFNM
jgi:hypothetical protein